MRQGPFKESYEYYDYCDGKVDQIEEWVSQSECGLFGFYFAEVPNECIDFCLSQYVRFGLHYDADTLMAVQAAASATFRYVDSFHPYALFSGVSDVDVTQDWSYYSYQIIDDFGKTTCREADPQFLETFVYMPGQAEHMFNEMLARPGLEALPNDVGHGIDDMLEGGNGEEIWDAFGEETEAALRRLCTAPGAAEHDKKRLRAYVDIAAWAAFIWLASPYGRDYRRRHSIMEAAMDFGEVILMEGTIIAPTHYIKHDRPPLACHRCHCQVWCVEHTMVGAETALICESCLYGHMAAMPNATCGTKFCKETKCPHHPLANLGPNGIYTAVRDHGQLTAMTKNHADLRLHSGPGRTLRLVDYQG